MLDASIAYHNLIHRRPTQGQTWPKRYDAVIHFVLLSAVQNERLPQHQARPVCPVCERTSDRSSSAYSYEDLVTTVEAKG